MCHQRRRVVSLVYRLGSPTVWFSIVIFYSCGNNEIVVLISASLQPGEHVEIFCLPQDE